MISHSDKENILKEFPNIKLSYGKIAHKIVYNAELYLAIPEGLKCFAWFTQYNGCNVCFIMELGNNKCIQNIKIANVCFSDELSYETILYGTIFNHNNDFFCIEDIFIFKGKPVASENWGNKLFIFNDLLKYNLKSVSYNNSFLVFGLPIMYNNIRDIIEATNGVKYKINSIQFKFFSNTNNYLFMSYTDFLQNFMFPKCHIEFTENIKPQEHHHIQHQQQYQFKNNIQRENTNTNYNVIKSGNINTNTNNSGINKNKKEAIFNVKPDLQQDIYHLYCSGDNNTETYVGLASISNFKTSVMMNKLFRIIKENDNLDALEESDDEEEFENEKEDLFVHLDREYKMVCAYNHKFKKWYPIRLADKNAKLTSSDFLYTNSKFAFGK